MNSKKKRLITSALPYVNNYPHLGTLIGCVLSADVFYRYCKIADYETLYICGTDEYGTTSETKAKQEGITPKELCDKYYQLHKEVYDWFNIEFSHFGRTTHPKQTEIVQFIFHKNYENGYITEGELIQPFCHKCDMYLADRYIEGTCPHCQYDKAKGDQCENCGKLLDPAELKNPKCITCSSTPEFKKTKHLFLDLEKLKPELEKWIDQNAEKNNWTQNAIQTTRGWLEQGLQKRCITRDLKWGIPVPLKGYENKVFYVWFDAPIGYISITASLFDNWEDWWKKPDTVELYQFIGKDNIPFHTVLFPATQLGTKENWTMLKTISSTEYLNYEDQKFSKSRGIGVFGNQIRETGIEADLYRYYLLRNRPEKNDTQFYWLDFMEKANGEIIANYANLVNRVLQFIHKFFDGNIPEFNEADPFFKSISFQSKIQAITELWEKVELKKALLDILDICSEGNKFFQDSKPWELAKSDLSACAQVLGVLTGFIRDISILLYPYIPATVEKVFSFLKLDKNLIKLNQLGKYQDLKNRSINQPEVLFKKLDKKVIEKFREQFNGQQEEQLSPAELFSQYHLKVGKIIKVERHPEADKLYVEKIDMGNGEIRQIVSGLVPYFTEEELLGKQVAVVYNLKPAVLRGVNSEGMLLAAETKKKKELEVVSPPGNIGDDILIKGSTPNQKEITIDDFFTHIIEVKNQKVVFKDQPLIVNQEEIILEKIANGKVR
ncbi:MAG: methionine--tRNA ligase [Spirochaetes bacterium]|nr:methionine--tRNA ligase [Spirochaetota bacterium]